MTNFVFVPSSAPLGAEIRGVDIAGGVDDETFAAIRDALHAYSVVFLRDQVLTPSSRSHSAGALARSNRTARATRYCRDMKN